METLQATSTTTAPKTAQITLLTPLVIHLNGLYQHTRRSGQCSTETWRRIKLLTSNSTYFSSLCHDLDYWHPITGLGRPLDSTLTIMFISSMHIYHTHRSEDPVFPAETKRYFPGFRDPFYFNADPRARPLACVDETSVCSPDGNTCWSMDAPNPRRSASDPAYWLMKWSLENSDTYDAIKWRLGSALLAHDKIAQSVSSPLAPN